MCCPRCHTTDRSRWPAARPARTLHAESAVSRAGSGHMSQLHAALSSTLCTAAHASTRSPHATSGLVWANAHALKRAAVWTRRRRLGGQLAKSYALQSSRASTRYGASGAVLPFLLHARVAECCFGMQCRYAEPTAMGPWYSEERGNKLRVPKSSAVEFAVQGFFKRSVDDTNAIATSFWVSCTHAHTACCVVDRGRAAHAPAGAVEKAHQVPWPRRRAQEDR